MGEEEAPPFLHTRVMAVVRSEGEAAPPWWRVMPWFRVAWAGPLLVLAMAFALGGYGLKQILLPARPPVPQSEMATPDNRQSVVAKTGTLTSTDGGAAVLAGFVNTGKGDLAFCVAAPRASGGGRPGAAA